MVYYSGSGSSACHARGLWTWLGSAYGEISVAALTGVLSLILAGLMAMPAQAQTEVTLVKNLAKTKATDGLLVSSGVSAAQEFTTGTNPAGYTLTLVTADFNDDPGLAEYDADVNVSIYTRAEDGTPGSSLYELADPSSIQVGWNRFSAPENATLDSNTRYFVVFKAAGDATYGLYLTNSNDEDEGAATGWEIGNENRNKLGNADWTSDVRSTLIRIQGTVLNNPPDFGAMTTTRSVIEQTPSDQNVGAPVTATDFDGDELTYTLGGADSDNFELDSATGQIKTKAELNPEIQRTHSVTVTADDGNDGGTTTITVTITVLTDDQTRLPILEARARAQGVIFLSWDAPPASGVTGYEIAFSTDDVNFTLLAASHDATQYVHHTGLPAGHTVYYQVRAIIQMTTLGAKNTVSAITESALRVALSLSSLNLEEGGSATYTVVLTGQPSSTVVVTHVSDNPDVTVSPTSLTFTTDNWEVPQSVTVQAAQDADDADEVATVTHSASGSNYQSSSVRVSVSDDEEPSSGSLGAEFYYIYYLGAVPGVHFGESFEVRVRLTDSLSRTDLTRLVGPDRGIRVTGGTVNSILFLDSVIRRVLVFQIQPSGHGDVTLTLEPLPCDASGAVCASEASGLAERVRHTVRGAGVPPVPTDLRVETVQEGGEERMHVSVVGTDEANKSRVQWKHPSQEWSEAEEYWRFRSAGPEGRHLCVNVRVQPHAPYDARVRWESPVGEGPWAYGTRADRSLQLTAEFRDLPTTHDGHTAFNFELRFSENVTDLSYVTLRDHAFTVTNGEVTGAQRLRYNKSQRWKITVEPAGNADVTIELPATTDCGDTGAICIGYRPLSAAISATVRGPTSPLTAEFRDLPTTHDGHTAFNFELRFSENVTDLSYVTLRDHAFTVTNGEVTGARRLVQGKSQRWEITVEPAGNVAVIIELPATTDCGDTGAICIGTRPLSAAVTTTVPGPGLGKLLALADGPLLLQNAPNPFNSQTVISWFLLKPGTTRLEVFALTGQRVAVLHQGPQQAGLHRLHWEGRDEQGRPLASGIYIYRLATAEGVLTQKLILLR